MSAVSKRSINDLEEQQPLAPLPKKKQRNSQINSQESANFVQPTVQDIPTDESYKILSSTESNDMKDKLVKIRECLASQEFKEDVLVLPNVFTNRRVSQDRFDPYYVKDKQFLMMVNRASIVEPMAEKLKGDCTMMLYGSPGYGRSFVVYQLVTRLMKDKNNFVVYVNKALNSLFYDLVHTVAAHLPDDAVNQILDRFKEQSIGRFARNTHRAFEFFDIADRFLAKENHNIRMIFVIDQIESIDREDVLESLVQLYKQYACVMAVSANHKWNEFVSNYRFKNLSTHRVSEELLRFTEDEFRSMCVIYERQQMSNPSRFLFSKEETAQIMSITGGMPLNLMELLDQYSKVGNLATALTNWTSLQYINRLNVTEIGKYLTVQTEFSKSDALENIQRLFSNKEVDYCNTYYDKRFIYLSESGKLRAVDSVTYDALYEFYSPMLNKKE